MRITGPDGQRDEEIRSKPGRGGGVARLNCFAFSVRCLGKRNSSETAGDVISGMFVGADCP